jgi:fatty acid desaturase
MTQRQQDMTADFREMRANLVNQGLFEPDYIHVYFRLLEIAFYFGMGAWLASYNIYASILSFIVFKTRCGWVQHEGGHVSLTGNKGIDRAIQSFTMGFGNGVSGVLTNMTHFRHHATPQKIKHDMDMDTTPLVAFFNRAFETSYHSKTTTRYMNRWWMRFQAWTFLPVVDGILVHLFWVYYLFPKKVFQRLCHANNAAEHTIMSIEAISMFAHHLIMPLIFYNGGVSGGGIAWCYFLLMVTNFCEFIYLFGHFSLSHSYTGVVPENKHLLWFEYAVGHTVNISTKSALVSWVMGYLNFQIEHHLFPSMPQYKNALAAPYVRRFCEKWAAGADAADGHDRLKYTEHSYTTAWRLMLSNLNQVGKHYYENGIAAPAPVPKSKDD